jgi:hypothetical protein
MFVVEQTTNSVSLKQSTMPVNISEVKMIKFSEKLVKECITTMLTEFRSDNTNLGPFKDEEVEKFIENHNEEILDAAKAIYKIFRETFSLLGGFSELMEFYDNGEFINEFIFTRTGQMGEKLQEFSGYNDSDMEEVY